MPPVLDVDVSNVSAVNLFFASAYVIRCQRQWVWRVVTLAKGLSTGNVEPAIKTKTAATHAGNSRKPARRECTTDVITNTTMIRQLSGVP